VIGAGAYLYWRMQQQPVPGFEPLPEPEHALTTTGIENAGSSGEQTLADAPGAGTPGPETPSAAAPLPLPAPAETSPPPAPEPPAPVPPAALPPSPAAAPDDTAALQARITELEAAVAALATRPARSGGGALILDEVAGLVALAEQRLQLARDIAGAESALRLAATRLTGADFLPLRDALADDLVALGAFRDVDVTALAAELAAMARQAPGLALARPQTLAAEAPTAPVSGWRAVLAAVWQSLRGLVEVRDAAEAADPLLNPAHAALARQQLALDLSAARVALLQRDAAGLRAALAPAIDELERHFDDADPGVRTTGARLREIADLDIAPALPSLARSVDALGLALRAEKAL